MTAARLADRRRRTPALLRFDPGGDAVTITVTDQAPAEVRRPLRGHVDVVTCEKTRADGYTEVQSAHATVRFPSSSDAVRVRLSPRLSRVDNCQIANAENLDDATGVFFKDFAKPTAHPRAPIGG